MSEIRVTHREKSREAIYADPDQYGNLSYWVGVSIDGEEQEKGCLVSHKGSATVMEVGDTFEQHGFVGIETKTSKKGNEFFKAARAASNNGTGGLGVSQRGDFSPEAQARIDAKGRAQGRAHAQEMALRYTAIKASLGKVTDFTPETLGPLIAWFYEDAQAAMDQVESLSKR